MNPSRSSRLQVTIPFSLDISILTDDPYWGYIELQRSLTLTSLFPKFGCQSYPMYVYTYRLDWRCVALLHVNKFPYLSEPLRRSAEMFERLIDWLLCYYYCGQRLFGSTTVVSYIAFFISLSRSRSVPLEGSNRSNIFHYFLEWWGSHQNPMDLHVSIIHAREFLLGTAGSLSAGCHCSSERNLTQCDNIS